jgi:hypothetical protein
MANTQLMQHPYPDKRQRPFYEVFKAMMGSLDAADHAARVDRNMAMMWASSIEFTVSHQVRWSQPIYLRDPTTGFDGVLAANAGGIALADGQAAYVRVARPPTEAYSLALTVAPGALPPDNESVMLFLRRGDRLWVRDHGVVDAGGSTASAGGGGGGGGGEGSGFEAGEVLVQDIALSAKESQGGGLLAIGRVRFDKADYGFSNAASQIFACKVEANLLTQTGSLQGLVRLTDVTGSPSDLLSFTVSSDQPAEYTGSFNPGAGVREYEVRAGMNPAGIPYNDGEEILVWRASIQVRTTF